MKAMNRLLILLLCILTCCVAEMGYVPDEDTSKAKSVMEPVVVVNDAKNISLSVDSCNAADMLPSVVEYGDTLVLEGKDMKPDTVFLYGGMASGNIMLYKGRMMASGNPVKATELCDSLGRKILHPIRFDVDVNGWND